MSEKQTADYVAGLLFSKDMATVVLIDKIKPDWQKGKLNAVGGKIETGESSHIAMTREFFEECGVWVNDWLLFCHLNDMLGYSVDFLFAIGDTSEIRQMEEEKPGIYNAYNLPERIIPNLNWLIPMAIHLHEDPADGFIVTEISE